MKEISDKKNLSKTDKAVEDGDKRVFIKKSEIIIIALIFAASLLFLFFKNLNSANTDRLNAVIYVGGEKYEQIDLLNEDQKREIKISAKLNVLIEVWQGGIKFVSSECPDKICIKAGDLTKHGDTAACLPADVAIVVE